MKTGVLPKRCTFTSNFYTECRFFSHPPCNEMKLRSCLYWCVGQAAKYSTWKFLCKSKQTAPAYPLPLPSLDSCFAHLCFKRQKARGSPLLYEFCFHCCDTNMRKGKTGVSRHCGWRKTRQSLAVYFFISCLCQHRKLKLTFDRRKVWTVCPLISNRENSFSSMSPAFFLEATVL